MFVPDDPDDLTQNPSDHPASDSSRSEPSAPAKDADPFQTADELSSTDPSATVSKTIGPYRLVRKLGEGGMGQVWLAEQTAPIQRLVAIKLIRAGVSDSVLLERFESERQALARMNHPTIAKVYDAGTTPDDTPYFVMEYVPGIPITLYCDQKRLSIRQRLELFLKVCEGVQHAHQKAILHRDLKPANILVNEIDGKPAPHIIDFGIAKAIGDRDPLVTMFTRAGSFVGTPVYMSPEQADPDVRDVDTRSDVYSLAVILYELLSGSLPFNPTQWRVELRQEQFRKLFEQDPPAPSLQYGKKTTTEADTATRTAKLRSTEPQKLVSELRGDLDWITLKALERDRARRYGSPSEFAADLQRFLNHEPVTARPASRAYRLRKYVRRHRLGVSIAAAAVLLLVAFSVTQAFQLRRIREERDRANRIADFMIKMFRVSDPSEARGNSITAREVLDKASKEIDTGLAKDPEMQAQMMGTMATVYDSLGLFPQSEALYRHSMEVRARSLGPGHRDTLESERNLAVVLRQESKYPEAERALRSALELSSRKYGPSDLLTLRLTSSLGAVVAAQGRSAEAASILQQGLHELQKEKNPNRSLTREYQQVLAICLLDQGKYAEAEKSFREVYELDRKSLGEDNPTTLMGLSNLAASLLQQGKFAEAEGVYRQVLESDQRILGPTHLNTLSTMGNLALSLTAEKRFKEAEPLYRQVVELETRSLGPDNHYTLVAKQQLADTLRSLNKLDEAEHLIRETLDSERRVLGPEHPDTLTTMSVLASVLVAQRRYSEAEAVYRQVLQVQTKVLTAHHPDTALTECQLAQVLALEDKREEAFPHLGSCLDDGPRPSELTEALADPSFNSLRSDPRFAEFLAKAKKLGAASAP